MDMQGLVDRIDQRLAALGLSASVASERATGSKDTIRNWKRSAKAGSKTGASMRTLEQVARVLQTNITWLTDGIGEEHALHSGVDAGGFEQVETARLPMRGEVAAGQWLETVPFLDDLEITEWVDGIAVSPSLLPFTYCLRVKGTSMNKIAPDGAYLICLDMGSGVEVFDRDVVVVERIREEGALREVTAKRLVRRGEDMVLVPESHDPMWQREIVIKPDDGDMDAEVRIVAKVKHVILPM